MTPFIYEILVKENENRMAVGLNTGSDPTWINHNSEAAAIDWLSLHKKKVLCGLSVFKDSLV